MKLKTWCQPGVFSSRVGHYLKLPVREDSPDCHLFFYTWIDMQIFDSPVPGPDSGVPLNDFRNPNGSGGIYVSLCGITFYRSSGEVIPEELGTSSDRFFV